jgi:hypothetical protein
MVIIVQTGVDQIEIIELNCIYWLVCGGVEAMPGLLKFALWSQMGFHMSTLKSIEIEAILQNVVTE